MKKLYVSFLLLSIGIAATAQDTTAPVLNKSNRIILHFNDTTGKFTQLARILIDRGYDIAMKDREFGILRTTHSPLRGGYSWTDQLEIKTFFRDSTITFSGITYSTGSSQDFVRYEYANEVYYSKKWYRNLMLSWNEMMMIAELLKPVSITYLTVDVTEKAQKVDPFKRGNQPTF